MPAYSGSASSYATRAIRCCHSFAMTGWWSSKRCSVRPIYYSSSCHYCAHGHGRWSALTKVMKHTPGITGSLVAWTWGASYSATSLPPMPGGIRRPSSVSY